MITMAAEPEHHTLSVKTLTSSAVRDGVQVRVLTRRTPRRHAPAFG